MELLGSHSERDWTVKDRRLTLLCAWTLLCPCLALAILAKAWLLLGLVGVPLAVACLWRRAAPCTTRSLVYSLTVAMLATVLLDQTFRINSENFFLPVGVTLPLALFLGTGFTFLTQNMVSVTAILCLGILASTILGTCLTNPQGLDDLPGSQWLRNRFVVFGVALVLQMLAIIPLAAQVERLRRRWRPAERIGPRRYWQVAALAGVVACTVAACFLIHGVYDRLDALTRPLYHSYLRRLQDGSYFGNSADLRQTLALKDREQAARVALRVISPVAPGYLRCRAFPNYREGMWRAGEARNALPALPFVPGLASRRFALPAAALAAPGARVEMNFLPAEAAPREALALVGNALTAELVASRILTDGDGNFKPEEWDSAAGYACQFDPRQRDAALPVPNLAAEPGLAAAYLQVPDELRPQLAAWAAEAGAAAGTGPTSARRALAVVQWLGQRCQYSLDVRPHPPDDPVVDFLGRTRQGHCELFAAAAALLLRLQGVPSRYVVGFVCTDRLPGSQHWQARLADCHAWVEYYDRERGAWQLLEATPANGIPGPRTAASTWAKLGDYPRLLVASLFAQVKRGYFARAVWDLLGRLADLAAWLFWYGPRGWSWLAVVGLAAGAAWRWHRRRARVPAPQRALHEGLQVIEHYLRGLGLVRSSAMTVRDLAGAARRLGTAQGLRAAAWLDRYESLRFDPRRQAEAAGFARQLRRELLRPKTPTPPPTTP